MNAANWSENFVVCGYVAEKLADQWDDGKPNLKLIIGTGRNAFELGVKQDVFDRFAEQDEVRCVLGVTAAKKAYCAWQFKIKSIEPLAGAPAVAGAAQSTDAATGGRRAGLLGR